MSATRRDEPVRIGVHCGVLSVTGQAPCARVSVCRLCVFGKSACTPPIASVSEMRGVSDSAPCCMCVAKFGELFSAKQNGVNTGF